MSYGQQDLYKIAATTSIDGIAVWLPEVWLPTLETLVAKQTRGAVFPDADENFEQAVADMRARNTILVGVVEELGADKKPVRRYFLKSHVDRIVRTDASY